MHVVLGKAASSLDKNIDPLDCKVINSLLIESRDSSSTDRVFPLGFRTGNTVGQNLDTVPVPAHTVSATGTGTRRPVDTTVSPPTP